MAERTTINRMRLENRVQRGSASVEAMLLIPALIGLFMLLFVGSSYYLSKQQINSAAGAAARAGSLDRTTSWQQTARAVALAGVRDNCVEPSVSVSSRPLPGESGMVTVHIACVIRVAGAPSMNVTSSGSAPVDQYRQRER